MERHKNKSIPLNDFIFQVVSSKLEIPNGFENDYITRSEDYLKRTEAITKNAQLVTLYFCERLKVFIQKVLKPHFGVKDYIMRQAIFFAYMCISQFNNSLRLIGLNSKEEEQFMHIVYLLLKMVLQLLTWSLLLIHSKDTLYL